MSMRCRLSLRLALSVIVLASGCHPEGRDASRSAPDSAPSQTTPSPASPVGDGTIEASWVAPTTNDDGSPLTDLAFYRLYYSTASAPCPASAFFRVASPTPSPQINDTVAYTLTGLLAGAQYFVAITAVDVSGLESACSPDASAMARSAEGSDRPAGGIVNAREHGGNAFARGQQDDAIHEPVLTLTGLTSASGPLRPGTTVTFTATAAGGTAPYQFKWLLWDGATWTVLGDWSAVNAFAWTPSTPNSNAAVAVWVRSAGNAADQPGASGTIPVAID